MTNFVPIKLSYKVVEAADGSDSSLSPVIFMHGLSGTKETWLDIQQIIANKTKRKTYAYDARNHGENEHCDEYSWDLNVDDLFHFMDTMNISKAILVGHSMSGLTASNAALRKPERCEAIFSEDAFIRKPTKEMIGPVLLLFETWVKAVRSIPKDMNDESEAIQYASKAMFKILSELNIPKVTDMLNSMKEKHSQKKDQMSAIKRLPDGSYDLKFNSETIFKAMKNTETLVSEPTGQYEGPAYFIHGRDSHVDVKKEEEHIKQHFPKAELIEFEGASHNVHSEFPDKFSETILNCLLKSRYVPVKLSYKVLEPTSGTDNSLLPIIFIHGLGRNKEAWDSIQQIIADKTRRKTYAYDARNHGESDRCEDFSFDLNVDDLFHFMDTMNIPKAVIVGHSMGGLTSSNAALRHPERIEAIVSVDMYIKKIAKESLHGFLLLLRAWRSAVRSIPTDLNDDSEALEFATNVVLNKLSNLPGIEVDSPIFFKMMEKFTQQINYPTPFKRNSEGTYDLTCNADVIFRALENHETLMRDLTGRFDGLAYFVYGSLSPVEVHKEEGHIKEYFPNAELIEFEGATHYPQFEFPEKFTDTIVNCLHKIK